MRTDFDEDQNLNIIQKITKPYGNLQGAGEISNFSLSTENFAFAHNKNSSFLLLKDCNYELSFHSPPTLKLSYFEGKSITTFSNKKLSFIYQLSPNFIVSFGSEPMIEYRTRLLNHPHGIANTTLQLGRYQNELRQSVAGHYYVNSPEQFGAQVKSIITQKIREIFVSFTYKKRSNIYRLSVAEHLEKNNNSFFLIGLTRFKYLKINQNMPMITLMTFGDSLNIGSAIGCSVSMLFNKLGRTKLKTIYSLNNNYYIKLKVNHKNHIVEISKLLRYNNFKQEISTTSVSYKNNYLSFGCDTKGNIQIGFNFNEKKQSQN